MYHTDKPTSLAGESGEMTEHPRTSPCSIAVTGPQDAAEWRAIPGWLAYDVSNDGQVRRVVQSRGARGGRILKPLLNRKTGYFSVCLSRQSFQKRIDVHRLVAITFLGDPPSVRHLIAHADGNRTNNCVVNLRWATQSENLSDCVRHGTAMIGSRNPATSLVELDVQAMRRMKGLGIPRSVIADGYGLHRRQVFKILARENWGHVA